MKTYSGDVFSNNEETVAVFNARTWTKEQALSSGEFYLKLPTEKLQVFKSWVVYSKNIGWYAPSFNKKAPMPNAKFKIRVWMVKEKENKK